MELEQQIEGFLFYRGEPVKKEELEKVFAISKTRLDEVLLSLKSMLENHGISLIDNGTDVILATHSALSSLIEKIRREELEKELSKASLETLSIVLYKNGVTRSEIDYIRGVNSSFILRNLTQRGLVQREENPKDARTYIYMPTLQTLGHLGVTRKEELPNFENVKKLFDSLNETIVDSTIKE